MLRSEAHAIDPTCKAVKVKVKQGHESESLHGCESKSECACESQC